MPATKESRRRHAKPAPQFKSLTPPSTLSVLSSSTSGSNSTVTPERAFQSSLRPSKRYEPQKVETTRPIPPVEPRKGGNEAHPDKANVNVFSYMDKEENSEGGSSSSSSSEDDDITEDTLDEDASTTSISPQKQPPAPEAPSHPHIEANPMGRGQQQNWRKGKVREGSLHSDSGISVRSSSPEQSSPVVSHAYPNVRALSSPSTTGPASSHVGRHIMPTSPPSPGSRSSPYPRDWSTHIDPDRYPEEYYVPSRPTTTQSMQVAKPTSAEAHRRQSKPLVRNRSHPQAPSTKPNRPGYDVLASVIDSRGDAILKPIYRKFEVLNNRILLYLQDEIAEMEGELRELDSAVAREDHVLGKTFASRRAESRLPSQLQWRRLDLLGRSYAKVEQYNRALASYSNLTRSLEPASHADINIYRDWVAEHAPIVEQEAAFLHNESDLVAVSAHSNVSSVQTQSAKRAELETPVIIVAFTLVSTIIVFKVVPRFLARIVISAMVGVASLCMLSPAVLSDFQSIKHWGRGITIYCAVMLVLAIVVN